MSQTLYERFTADLRSAMRERDKAAVSALRTLMASVDNAGAVPLDQAPEPVEGQAGEVARRELTEEDILELVRHEVADLEGAVDEYQAIGQQDRAETLRYQADVLRRYLP